MGDSEGQDITDASVENVGKYSQTSLMSQANTNNRNSIQRPHAVLILMCVVKR